MNCLKMFRFVQVFRSSYSPKCASISPIFYSSDFKEFLSAPLLASSVLLTLYSSPTWLLKFSAMGSMGTLTPPVYYLRCMITWPCVSPPTWLLEFSAVPYLVRSGYILLYQRSVKVGKNLNPLEGG